MRQVCYCAGELSAMKHVRLGTLDELDPNTAIAPDSVVYEYLLFESKGRA